MFGISLSRKDHISLSKLAQVYLKLFQLIKGFNHPYMEYNSDSGIVFFIKSLIFTDYL